MNIDKLEMLLHSYEGPKLDFKEKFSLQEDHEKKEFAKDICAIANSKGGRGYIIYGVKDGTQEVVGVPKSKLEEERIQQVVTNRTEPPVQIRIENVDYDEKNLIVVTIFKSDDRPHQIKQNGSFYIRRGSTTDLARREEIAAMMQETGILNFETIIMGNVTIDMLNWEALDKYIDNFKGLNENNKMVLLEALGIIKKDARNEHYHPTMGGMLLFGKMVQTFLPNTGVKIYSERGVYHVTGTINEILDTALEKCKEIMEYREYPYKAIDYALSNALAHRDYWDTTRCTTIRFMKDRIEISNPGALPYGDRVEKISENEITIKRNAWLYDRLILLDKNDRYLRKGTGINTIRSMYSNPDSVRFNNLLKNNIFKVVLPI